jgi:hypothetical protein
MAITKIQAGALPADVITTAAIDDASITHAKLHTTMDLSSKTVTLPTLSTLNTTGNILVGTVDTNVATNSGSGNDGVNIHPDSIRIARTDSDMLLLNRLNSDGDIIKFLKDGAAVGSIGANGSRAYMAGPQKGIKFGNVSADPCTDTGAAADNAYDLGGSSIRWKDLYLSGTAFAGSRINMNNTNGGIFFGTTGTNGGGGFADNGAIARAGGTGYHSSGSSAGDLVIGAERQSDILFGTQSASTGALSTRMIIKSSGNVGIGTNSPGEKLSVNGSVQVLGNNEANYSAKFISGYDSTHGLRITTRINSSTESEVLGVFANSGGGSPRLALNPSNGWNVGIGTTSPDAIFTVDTNVAGASTGTIARFHSSKGANDSTFLQIAATRHPTASVQRVQLQAFDDDGSTGRTLALNSSGGNVGIGTNSPNATLTVSQSANNIFAVERTGVSSGSGQFGINVENNSQVTVSYDDGAPLVFGTASSPSTHTGFTERMRINSSGIVTKPYQPIGSFSHSASVNYSQDDLTSANFYSHTWVNQGNHFNASTGRFTCPVAGIYRIYFRATGTGNSNIRLRKNGSTINEAYENAGTNHSVSSEAVFSCAANDYLHIQIASGNFLSGTQHKQVTFELMS